MLRLKSGHVKSDTHSVETIEAQRAPWTLELYFRTWTLELQNMDSLDFPDKYIMHQQLAYWVPCKYTFKVTQLYRWFGEYENSTS